MPSVLRSLAVLSFVSAFAVLSAPGCSQQGEGERCDKTKNGDADCDDGLVCVVKNELIEGTTDRCCPADANAFNDARCTRGTPNNNGGTSAGGTSTGGSAGSSGSSLGGAAGEAMGGTAGEAMGGTAGEATGGTAGSPASTDGGTSGAGGAPPTDGGTAAAGTAGHGGAG